MKLSEMKPSTGIYLSVNFVGALIYAFIVFGIRDTAKAELRDYYDFGDSLTFITMAVPILFVSAAYSIFWSIHSVVEITRKHGFESVTALAVVSCTWTGLLVFLKYLPAP